MYEVTIKITNYFKWEQETPVPACKEHSLEFYLNQTNLECQWKPHKSIVIS